MLRVAASLVVLASVALAGCSGGTPEPITRAQLSKAATSSAEATSGRFAVSPPRDELPAGKSWVRMDIGEGPIGHGLGEYLDTARQYKEMPVDAWLDEQGLVRQLVLSFAAGGPEDAVEVSVTLELYDYGEAVDIALPPAEDVVDAADLD